MLRSADRLLTNRRYTIRCQRDGLSGQLYVEGHDLVKAKAPGSLESLDIEPEIYLGHINLSPGAIPKR